MHKLFVAALTALSASVALAQASPPAAPPAAAQASTGAPKEEKETVVTKTEGERARELASASAQGLHFSGTLNQTVGTGTFVDASEFGYVASSLILGPRYGFTFKGVPLAVSARELLSWEFTPPQNSVGRHYGWSDLLFSLSAPNVYTEGHTGIDFTPGIGFSLPISMQSQLDSAITSASASVALRRRFFDNRLTLNYRLTGGKGFFANPAAVIPASSATDQNGIPSFLGPTGQADVASNGLNLDWSVSNYFGASYQITDKLDVSAFYWVTNAWNNAATTYVDPYTSSAVDSNGNPVAGAGDGRTDRVTTSIALDYTLSEQFSVGAGIYTAGPPRTNDNQGFRNPFFDTQSWARNLTTFFLSVSATL